MDSCPLCNSRKTSEHPDGRDQYKSATASSTFETSAFRQMLSGLVEQKKPIDAVLIDKMTDAERVRGFVEKAGYVRVDDQYVPSAPIPTPTPTPAQAAKGPWEMRQVEFLDQWPHVRQGVERLSQSMGKPDAKALDRVLEVGVAEHRTAVAQALREGKPVPPEVLADYPDLVAKSSDRTEMTRDEWLAEGERRFGPDKLKWRFVCPSCKGIQAVEDFKSYIEQGVEPSAAFLNCIGRYDGKHGDVEMCSGKSPCNYASGGLLNINPVSVTDSDGTVYKVFAYDNQEGV